MPSNPVNILTDATNGFRNNIRRIRSPREPNAARTKGKENPIPSSAFSASPAPSPLNTPTLPTAAVQRNTQRLGVPNILITSASRPDGFPATPTPTSNSDRRWAAVDGKIILKVYVSIREDIWRMKVSQDVTLTAFREKVERKLGYSVTFSEGSGVHGRATRRIVSEEDFQRWIKERVTRDGRNRPLTANKTR